MIKAVIRIKSNGSEWIVPVDYIKWLNASMVMKSRRKKEKKVDGWLHLFNNSFRCDYEMIKFVRKELTWDQLKKAAEKVKSEDQSPSLFHASITLERIDK